VNREELEQECREIGRRIARSLPDGVGFVLSIFDFGPGGNMAYISTGQREDCIRMLRELLEHVEQHTN
jgi:hypothetical protein